MIGVPGFIIGMKWLAAYRAMKKAKARYITPLEFKKLPQPGPNSIEVGRIAETDVKAYINIDQLMVHSIAAGGTGSGKTVSAMVCAEELLKRKVPVIVFDPTAQWTGFMKPCTLKQMLDLYPKFGLKPSDTRSFKTNIILVDDPNMKINIKDHMKPGELTVFVLNRLKPGELDPFVVRTIQSIFDMRPKESKKLELLLVYDEVHRLLPKYGGKGGYVAIEKGAREFRKWGIGLYLISQVLLDFKGAIRANIATEVQLRTKYEGDINRVKTKRQLKIIINMLLVGIGIQGLLGLLQRVLGHGLGLGFLGEKQANYTSEISRVRGTLAVPNQYGAYLILLIPIAASFYISAKNKKEKYWYSGILALAIFGLFFSLSRSSWFGLIGAIIVMFCALESWVKALIMLVIFLLIQQIEGTILTPILTKRLVGLPPVLVIIALMIGGKLWGVLGAVLAIPLFGLLYEFSSHFLN